MFPEVAVTYQLLSMAPDSIPPDSILKQRLRAWNRFALAYSIAAILPLTLISFAYTGANVSYGWALSFTLEDFARNVLLFLPLGSGARYGFNRAHWTALALGFGLSLFIEVTQLFIVARTSNVADLVGNGMGAYLGSILCQKLLKKYLKPATATVSLAFMLVPLSWISALRSITEPYAGAIALFYILTGLTLIQLSSYRQKILSIPAAFWLVLSIIPFFNTQPAVGTFFTAALPIALYITGTCSTKLLKRIAIAAIPSSLLLTLLSTGIWYFSPSTTLIKFELILRLTEIGFVLVAAILSMRGFAIATQYRHIKHPNPPL